MGIPFFQKKECIELGSGTGLTGIVAALVIFFYYLYE